MNSLLGAHYAETPSLISREKDIFRRSSAADPVPLRFRSRPFYNKREALSSTEFRKSLLLGIFMRLATNGHSFIGIEKDIFRRSSAEPRKWFEDLSDAGKCPFRSGAVDGT